MFSGEGANPSTITQPPLTPTAPLPLLTEILKTPLVDRAVARIFILGINLPSRSPMIQLEGLGERCKLPQRLTNKINHLTTTILARFLIKTTVKSLHELIYIDLWTDQFFRHNFWGV